jgi:hypothetical protein
MAKQYREGQRQTLKAATRSCFVSPVLRSASVNTLGSALISEFPAGTLSTSLGGGGGGGGVTTSGDVVEGFSDAFDVEKKGMVGR